MSKWLTYKQRKVCSWNKGNAECMNVIKYLRWPSGLRVSFLKSWKRKVVGSNPGDVKFDHHFSFGDWVDLIGSIWLGPLQKGDCNNNNNYNKITTITRGDLNQPSSIWICGAIFKICQKCCVIRKEILIFDGQKKNLYDKKRFFLCVLVTKRYRIKN